MRFRFDVVAAQRQDVGPAPSRRRPTRSRAHGGAAVGDGGFAAVYVAGQSAQVELRVDRGGFSDELCLTTPLSNLSDPSTAAPPAAAVTCERDETGWSRASGGRHEHVIVRGLHVLRLAGSRDQVDRTTLETAITNAQQVDAPAVPPGDTASSTTIRRGDLPSSGDGAPDNDVGPGG